jgi:predicted nuclease of predicted toxin-antitoxin system
MRLLLDENCSSRRLTALLRAAGHVVESVAASLGAGASDGAIFHYAAENGLAIVTKDVDDFRLAASGHEHTPGILLIYEGHGYARLTDGALARAVGNVESIYSQLDGLILALNEFTW